MSIDKLAGAMVADDIDMNAPFRHQADNVAARFFETSEAAPDLLAIILEQVSLNYEDFASFVWNFAARVHQDGVRQGDVVCIDSDDFLVSVPLLLATSMLGASWVTRETYLLLSEEVSPTHFYTSFPSTIDTDHRFRMISREWGANSSGASIDDGCFVGYADPEFPWIFSRTSGTTGRPKLIAFSQRVSRARALTMRDDFVFRETVFASLFDCNARPYVTRVLAALLNGSTIVYSTKTKLWEMAGVNFVYGSTAQFEGAFSDVILDTKIPVVHITGSKHNDRLTRHLLKSFGQVVDLYAASETNRSFKNVQVLGPNGAIETYGQPVADCTVEIIDDGGHSCPTGEIGTVRVKSAFMIGGYLNNPEATAQSFRDGWFYPGDFGYWGDGGQLAIMGRHGDVINSGGIKVNALEIDELLQETVGIRDAMCFGYLGDHEEGSVIIAFIKYEPGADKKVTESIAKKRCREHLGPFRTPARFVEYEDLPRAHDGGAQRFKCEGIYRDLLEGKSTAPGSVETPKPCS